MFLTSPSVASPLAAEDRFGLSYSAMVCHHRRMASIRLDPTTVRAAAVGEGVSKGDVV